MELKTLQMEDIGVIPLWLIGISGLQDDAQSLT